ncbi:MAG: acetate--CoA ligase family protein [Spirochaetales bacterium]|nr:acetate--CoA ligase family protein [Spirochaetales bacterium]
MGEAGWRKKVDAILQGCRGEGRTQLFEHEVYAILDCVGMMTPSRVVVKKPEEVTKAILAGFGSSKVVIKVISVGIAHKQKLGGVKVVYKDTDFVRYSMDKMRGDLEGQGYTVEGFLLVEFVDYSRDLGNEILLGFRETDTFGPVLSFSKGGQDAEHFAANFSPPNLVLPPIDKKWATASISSAHIYKKYLAEGRQDAIDAIIEAKTTFSRLSVAFSDFFESESSFVLKEFEINPFVFDEEGTFIALDGYGVVGDKTTIPRERTLESPESLDPFFHPTGIAVVGISRKDPDKSGNQIVRNLLELGREDVYCVNPSGGSVEIFGRSMPLYPSITAVGKPLSLVVVTVPAEATLPVVQECAEAGVPAVLLIPGGFSETSKNTDLEEKILKVAREKGMRIMGPNCLGIVYAGKERHESINTFFIPEEKFKVNLDKNKNVAILSQSGALGIVEIYNLRNAVSPKVIVSYGNQLDIDPCDLVRYFADEPGVDVIGLYIEGFKSRAGRCFFKTASRIKKPIVVYKAGRTPEGRKATASHTASMSGEYAVARAAMKQAGLVVADTMADHADFIKTFALFNDVSVEGTRTAVITNAGYEKTNAADNLGELTLSELDEKTRRDLAAVLPSFVVIEPLLDVTPMVSDEDFVRCVEILLASPSLDSLCISIVPHAGLIHTTDREVLEYKHNVAAGIVDAAKAFRKPVVVSVTVTAGADANYNRFAQIIESGGVPTFLSAERAMMCLNEFVTYKLVKEKKLLSEWLK